MKISVLIPCTAGHEKFLDELLLRLRAQTRPPDEVIISLSENLDRPKVERSLITASPFPVMLRRTGERAFAGRNRNLAADHATGEIFIFQDADDLPHPQRVAMISDAFESRAIDLLLHGYVRQDANDAAIVERTCYTTSQLETKLTRQSEFDHEPVANGVPAVHRRVFERVRYDESRRFAEDVDFNRRVFSTFDRAYYLHLPIYIYRWQLSSAL